MKEPTRGVRRTPTGDSLGFGLALHADECEETSNSVEEVDQAAKQPAKKTATKASQDESPRRPIRRAPTGDETSFAMMVGLHKAEAVDEESDKKQHQLVPSIG